MDAVTAAAGVSKQTVYSYFSSKQELLAQVLLAEAEKDGRPNADAPVENVAQLRAALVVLTEDLVSACWGPGSTAVMRLVLGEAFRIPELRGVVAETAPGRLLAAGTELIADADRRGLIDAPRPDLSARMLVGALMSYVMIDGLLQVDLPSPPDLGQREYIVDSILAVLAVRR
jgi:AcrR family transcriptional regulator